MWRLLTENLRAGHARPLRRKNQPRVPAILESVLHPCKSVGGTAIRSQAAWDQWETERENWMSSLTPTDLQGWSTDSKIAGTRG